MAGVVVALEDLFFTAKFEETARRLGVALTVAHAWHDVLAAVRAQRPALVILDLEADACRPAEVIRAIKGDPDVAATPLLGYHAHVRDDVRAAALQAGCDEVLPRSALSARLPDLLRRALSPGA